MHSNPLRKNLKPHLWFQLYWVVYLIWFFWLDLTVKNPKYIIHASLDDLIPFCEWFVFPYCSWFFLLAGVTALLWWYDTASYDKLCLMMFSGMTFCLILYMVLPNGLDIRPTAEAIGRDNIAMRIMQMLWNADASVNVCPSIHCQSSGCMALAFSGPRPPRPESAGLGLVASHLRFHGLHKTAFHRGCGLRSGAGGRVGTGTVPEAQKRNVKTVQLFPAFLLTKRFRPGTIEKTN